MGEYDYKPNSHKYKERQAETEEKRATKVIAGKAKTKKKNEIKKFTDTFVAEDARNIGSTLMSEFLVPAIKKTISDLITNGIDMLFWGEAGHSNRKRSNSDYVSYRNYSDRSDRDRGESRARRSFDFDDIIFASRGDAEATLDQLNDILEAYGVVRVLDLYDSVELTPPYTANRYGWTSLRNAEVVRLRGGDYIIKLPRAMVID